MAYDIELMSVGEDLYAVLGESAALLNSVQAEFRFRLTSLPQRLSGLSFSRTEYSTAEIWFFLREQRKKFGGNRPYIIAFVNSPLKSSELANIFGSHEAVDGLAVVTLHSSTQYVREARRFCCYYLSRYSLSFVNPSIKAHNDQGRKNCYFHKKLYKPDLRASMDSGYLCDADQNQLDNPAPGSGARRLSDEEREALRKMRQIVSGDYPYALVMKGGGVKGLAFAAALLELEKYFWFDRHVGASAGAIAAVLLAAGYSPAELVDVLSKKPFRDFKDAPLWKVPFNIALKRGCYPGDHFLKWIANMLGSKIVKQGEIVMSDLNGAVIYASRRGPGTVIFDSAGERKETAAAFATRCSMSIPVFFVPQMIDGRRIYDGGLRNNFPVTRFLADHPGTPFVALYLSSSNDKDKAWMASELVDILIDGEERQVVDTNPASVVVIDTRPIGTVDFNLHPIEKEFLLKVGRASALTFLRSRKLDDGPDSETVESAFSEAEKCRSAVQRMRKWRRGRRICIALLLFGVAYLIGPMAWHALAMAWETLRKFV
jgi:predicted acylesterase/phospholipase RssA